MQGGGPTDERWARAKRAYAAASQSALEAARGPAELNPALRVGDAERQAVVAALQGHYVAGRLDSDELSERLDQALAARTASQLRVPLRDLPTRNATVQEAPQVHAWWAPLTRMPGVVLTCMVALMVLSWVLWLPGLRF
jgi:hypothetical protein